jgi:photosystem II stability/assembly factor-like uncharacterized protein
MKKVILFTLFISIPIILICQTDWTLLNSGTTQNLNSVDFFDENNGLVVGDNGLILKTIDGGDTWNSVTSGTSNNLNGVSYVNADTTVVVGDSATILRTTDGGSNWVPITVGVYSNLFSIDINAGGNGIAGGTDQTILKTDDAGATWSITQTGYMGGGWQGAQMVDGSIGFVFGSNSIFQPFVGKTTNSGTSFSFYNFYFVQGAVSYEGKLYDGYFFDDFNGITAGRRWDGYGCISSTSDLNNWTTQHFPTAFYSIDFSTETDGYVVGGNGTVLHTTDGGTVWEAEDSGVFSQLNSVLFVNEDLGFIAGNNGVILKKQENTIYVSGDVSGVWSADTVYVVGEITIPDEETLTIDPGTYIEFQGHYKFNVQGQILAVGNEQDSIYFTALNHDDGWHGIRFDNTPATNDSSKFYYCNFEYGKATGAEPEDRSGGALYFKNYGKAHIAYSTFYNNFATLGAGIHCSFYSSPLIEFNDISYNTAGGENPGDGGGAGISIYYYSDPIIRYNNICNNFAYGAAGILCQNDSNPIIINNSISENGGLMYVGIGIFSSNPLLINNLIANNYAEFIGGGITCTSYFSPVIINNTIVNNYACNGGGIVCGIDSTPQLINNIIWNNNAVDGDQIYLMGETSDPDFYYCNVQGGISEFGGDGAAGFNGDYENCIDSDPLFLGTGEHSYSLLDDSPCVNTGTPDTTGLNLPEYDLAGNLRVFGGRIDMGAYENQNVVVNTDENLIPLITKLNQNYPNPFNPSTTISFSTTKNTESTELIIYNIKGQKVKMLVNEILSVGVHSVIWDGTDENRKPVSSGIYFYQLKVGKGFSETKRMLLLK